MSKDEVISEFSFDSRHSLFEFRNSFANTTDQAPFFYFGLERIGESHYSPAAFRLFPESVGIYFWLFQGWSVFEPAKAVEQIHLSRLAVTLLMSQKLSWMNASALLVAVLFGLLATSGCQYAATGHNIEGKKLYGEGQYGLALQRFQQAIAANPNDADAYYNMGAAYHQLGRQTQNQAYLAQAENLYLQALQRNPVHVDSYRGRAVLMAETGRTQQAAEMLQGWVMQNQQSADARVELARFYQEQGDAQTARIQLEQAVQLDPNNTRALNALGYVREQAGDYAQAMLNYQRSLSLNGMQPDVSSRVAQIQQASGGYVTPPPTDATRTVNSGFSFPIR